MKENQMNKVILPELGEGIQKATVACWHFKVGDKVSQDDDIVEVVTDKASFNIPAGQAGQVTQIFIEEGREAKVGETLAVIS
jgi:pyruvate/2-oxoglutarate dehydrogenase complex dihydrolipoamide acyltransferase (E2) component